MRILFSSTVEKAEEWLPALRAALPADEFTTEPGPGVEIALVASPPPGTFERLPDLRLVQSVWMGVERLLADPAVPRGVPLSRLIDPGMVAAMSETVLAHVLDWHRHHYRYRAYKTERRWHRHRQYSAAQRTVGILGLGELGADAARKLAPLGFRLAGWSRSPKSIPGLKWSANLEEVLAASDALVCLLPLTADTRGILNRRTLSLVRKGGCLINLARGPHVVRDDLLALLDAGHLAQAYLDVFDEEPLPQDDALWRHPRVNITPHSAALSNVATAIPRVVQNVERVRRGEPALNLVDRTAGY